MICYRDMVFSPYYKYCNKGSGCERALTKEVEERAEMIRLPVCSYLEKPECFEKYEEQERLDRKSLIEEEK